ncbi:DUF3592 domain-containing protein [Pseudoduganella aquatica]|uniref:DUF3592 domain-containing protein n=1 Tax=Pseudoduganella aquatica TaxID=2660641 RepID=UPI001E602A58|nr:DUF3592 domain-containing protein [Pseudoduganella aquatica]
MRLAILLFLLPLLLIGVALCIYRVWFKLSCVRTEGRGVDTVARPWKSTDPDAEGIHYHSVIEFTAGRQSHRFESSWQHNEPQPAGLTVKVEYRAARPEMAQENGGWLMSAIALLMGACMASFAARVLSDLLR